MQEIEDVVARPEVLQKLRFSPLEAGALLLLLRRRARFISPVVRKNWISMLCKGFLGFVHIAA